MDDNKSREKYKQTPSVTSAKWTKWKVNKIQSNVTIIVD